jgi:hypothetical protein
MLLLYGDRSLPEPANLMERHFAVWREAKSKGQYLTSEAIGGTENATTVRIRNGKALVSDGPFMETKEVLGGFYLLDCANLDEALEYAKKIPDSENGAVEIRPVMFVPGWEYEVAGERRPFS